MAVPKRRTSKARKNKRRANWKLEVPGMIKCSNCGADLKIDDSRMLKYCPYCGREVEMEEQVPDTVMGVMRSFGKSLLSQRAEQKRYEREHASEIAEEKRKTAREERKHMVKMLSIMMGGMTALALVMFVTMRLFPGLFA